MQCVVAKGTFYEVGRCVGRATKEEIRFQAAHLVPDILKSGFAGDELGMLRAARSQHAVAGEFWPESHAFLEGMANGVGMSLDALLPIAYCEEIAIGPSADAMKEKCSTIVVRSEEGWVLGHQEDYLPSFLGKLVVYDLRFDGYPRMVSLNYPGTFPGLAGSLNAAGVATANNSLWPSVQPGISKQVKHFRATLEESVFGAAAWTAFPPPTLTDHFTVLGAEEDIALSMEVTDHPDAPVKCEIREIVHDRDGDGETTVRSPFWHSNHVRWLEPWASGLVRDPANYSSALRAHKMRDICRSEAPCTARELERLLRRPDGVLNRRENDKSIDACFTITLATVIVDLSLRKIVFVRYCRGNLKAERNEYEL